MHDNTTFSQNIDTVFSDLQNFAKTDAVLGTPLFVGDKTLVPVMSVTLGYGSTPGKDAQNNQGTTTTMPTGLGLGARVNTSAVVVIDKDTISMLPTNEKSNMGQLMNNIPQSLMNSIPQSVMNMGQSVMQKIMPQGGQQGAQQNSQQSGQQTGQQATQQGMQQNNQQSPSINLEGSYSPLQQMSNSQQNKQQGS